MKKRITILAIDEKVSRFFKEELEKIFGSLFNIDYRHLDREVVPPIYDTDLILYTDPEILNLLINKIKCDAPTLMMKRTITRKALRKIKAIPAGKKALVANINQYMANETMALIYQLGITHVQFYPYYQGKDNYPADSEYIIVPEDEPYDFLPEIDAEIILIGNRVFDISNVLDILSILRVDSKRAEEIIKKYLMQVPTFWYGFDYGWENRRVLLNQWNLLLDELTTGVIISDAEDKIELANRKAREILSLSSNINGKSLAFLLEKEPELKTIFEEKEIRDKLVKYLGREMVVTVKRVEFDNTFYGRIILINPYKEMVKVQQKIHKQIVGKGYYTKHTFKDIIGNNPRFCRAKEIAAKVATSRSTVLLVGDSGTGKELFAGAIHNASPRRQKPFVAINCATLPENLLESELFGYEEGAFTGAKKGGKMGLLERAHQGTIFLDEIGDLPLKLQARLLRALEEKEIIRLGGDSIISIDVRIIAATNRDLQKLVEEGHFRKDLYYRLNVFRIDLPRLVERKDDILLLIDHFLNKWSDIREVNRDFKEFSLAYSWPGNVRELKNTLEYMLTISNGESLQIQNLPDYMKKREYMPSSLEEDLVLKLIYEREGAGKPCGRRSLFSSFRDKYYHLPEMEIRDLLHRLEERRHVIIKQGRRGTQITEKGCQYLGREGYTPDNNFML